MGKKIKEGEQKERKNKGETILSFFLLKKLGMDSWSQPRKSGEQIIVMKER